jgi:hypothetical protein
MRQGYEMREKTRPRKFPFQVSGNTLLLCAMARREREVSREPLRGYLDTREGFNKC